MEAVQWVVSVLQCACEALPSLNGGGGAGGVGCTKHVVRTRKMDIIHSPNLNMGFLCPLSAWICADNKTRDGWENPRGRQQPTAGGWDWIIFEVPLHARLFCGSMD